MLPSNINATLRASRGRLLLLSAASACLAASCSLFRPELVLTGNVLEMQGDVALVSVHSTDGARTGMQLEVYQINLVPAVKVTAPPSRHPERTGSATLTEVIGDHAVRARLTEGMISRNHDVELRGHH